MTVIMDFSRRDFLKVTGAIGAMGVGAVTVGAQPQTQKWRMRWDWRLRIGGEVALPGLYGVEDLFRQLPSRLLTLPLTESGGAVHLGQWQGVHLNTLMRIAQPHPEAKFLHVLCGDGHRECFAVGELERPRALLAHTFEDHLLEPNEGGPLRLIIPWRFAERSCVGVDRLEFHREPLEDVDPLADAIPTGEPIIPTGELGAPLPSAQADWGDRGPWEIILNPGEVSAATDFPLAYQRLDNPSFELGNTARTSLIMAGVPAVLHMEEMGEDSPLISESVLVRLHVANIIAEIGDPTLADVALSMVNDESPAVAALSLETCGRMGEARALEPALSLLNHEEVGLALTALVAVERLGGSAHRQTVEDVQSRGGILRAEALRILERWS